MSRFGEAREELNEASEAIERYIKRRLAEGFSSGQIIEDITSVSEVAMKDLIFEINR